MPFDLHAFISYAHIDNQPLPTEKDGWVTLFHRALQQLLAGRLGGQVQIWRDDKLRGNDVFSEEIVAQFPRTAAFISVLTPRYLKSEWCAKEIESFCDAAQGSGGVVLESNKCRIFKVLKLPVEQDDGLPDVLSQVLGYEFYELDTDRTPRELDPAYGEKSKQDFLRKLAKLAWDIKLLLDDLSAQTPAEARHSDNGRTAKPAVYLAECSRDRRPAREIIEAELKRLGYTIYPDLPLPQDEGEYVAAVDRLLQRCRFAIHLVGGNYGLVPDGPSHKSVVVLQNEAAVKHSRAGTLERVIWLPEGTRSEHREAAAFIDGLHHDAEMQFGADLITGDLETLKGAIHAALRKIEKAPAQAPPAPVRRRAHIHVLCDARDRKDSLELLRLLKESAEVSLPIFAGDAAAVREANQALLMSCDLALLFYGAGDEAWKFHQQNELKRIRALRPDRPLPAEAIYLAPPASEDKELIIGLAEANLINALTGFPRAAVTSWLTSVDPIP